MLLRKLVAVATVVALASPVVAAIPAHAATIRVTATTSRIVFTKVGTKQTVRLTVRGTDGSWSWTRNWSSRAAIASCTRHFHVLTITSRRRGTTACHVTVKDSAGRTGRIDIPVRVGPKTRPSLLPVRSDPFPRTAAMSGRAYGANRSNPLVGGRWAINNGDNHLDESYIGAHYNRSGSRSIRRNLYRIGSHPYVPWFSAAHRNVRRVRSYLGSEQRRNPNALVQIALFGIFSIDGTNRVHGRSVGGEANTTPLSRRERARYRSWTRGVSSAIGRRRVAIILEPDAALLAHRPSGGSRYADAAVRRGLIRWAARYFRRHNRRTAVYLDAGDSDWLRVTDAVTLLEQIGVRYTRGFALGATHYSSAAADITYARKVANRLAGKGTKRKKAVIDTADSGHPYTHGQWTARFGARGFDNSRPCRSLGMRLCNSIGILPTWKTGDRALNRLPASYQPSAKKYVDAYLWFGRPWLTNQAHPFNLKKAVSAARYDRYFRHG